MSAGPDLVLRGGMVVDEHGVHDRDLLLSNGSVAAWLARGEAATAHAEIDVGGRYLLPGLVDAHVHFREPGMTWKEDFETGSRSAVAGGVTTVLVMPTDDPWTVSADDVAVKRDLAAGRIHCDVGLQATLRYGGGTARAAAAAGAVSIEVFTADVPHDFLHGTPARLVDTFTALKGLGIRIAASPGDQSLLEDALARLTPGSSSIADFVASRPALAEAAGVGRIILAASAAGVPVHIRQVNSRLGIATLKSLRHLADVTVETSPQNWSFTGSDLERLGAVAKVSPPFRQEEDRLAVLRALADGDIDIVVTDHAPHLLSEKEAESRDFANMPGGFPGLQSLLPALLALVAGGTLTLGDVARIGAARPAAVFGLAGKGRLDPGFDADILVLDPGGRMTVRADSLLGKARFTPFEGLGAPYGLERVFLRGTEIVRDGQVLGAPIGRIVRPEFG